MPVHDFRCRLCGVVEERVVQVADLENQLHSAADHLGLMDHVWRKAPVGFVQRDICYDSPIDGRPITNKHARIEDLRRNNCHEYDPGERQDLMRAKAAEEAALEKAIDASVDEFVAKAPARKLENLERELRAGASVEVDRSTPQMET